MTEQRPWEVWTPAKAQEVDAYWRASRDERQRREQLGELLVGYLRPGESLLEVGCGSGLVYAALRALLRRDLRYVGVDNSPAMLALARRKQRGGDFREADAFALPFAAGEVDVACAFEVFGHMPDCTAPLAELLRVTKRLAMFTFWAYEGAALQEGGDHYVYPVSWVYLAIARALQRGGGYSVTTVPVGPTLAFVVEKTA